MKKWQKMGQFAKIGQIFWRGGKSPTRQVSFLEGSFFGPHFLSPFWRFLTVLKFRGTWTRLLVNFGWGRQKGVKKWPIFGPPKKVRKNDLFFGVTQILAWPHFLTMFLHVLKSDDEFKALLKSCRKKLLKNGCFFRVIAGGELVNSVFSDRDH